jgi:hypothetical protein
MEDERIEQQLYRRLATDAGFVDPDAGIVTAIGGRYVAIRSLLAHLPRDLQWHEAPFWMSPGEPEQTE